MGRAVRAVARATAIAALLALFGIAAACAEQPGPPSTARPAPAAAAPAPVAPAPATTPDAGAAAMPTTAAEACADRWLAEHGLNPFGDPPETSYPGGTPLFDERTGVKKSRLEHLFGKREALKAACSGAGQK